MISISPSFYPFQWIIQNQNHKSSFLIRQLSISMDNLKIITLSFITWISGTEIITEHYFNHLKCHHISHHTFVYFAFVGQHNGCRLCVCHWLAQASDNIRTRPLCCVLEGPVPHQAFCTTHRLLNITGQENVNSLFVESVFGQSGSPISTTDDLQVGPIAAI